MKIHFGSGNDSAEDYYYVDIWNCTTEDLGLRNYYVDKVTKNVYGSAKIISNVLENNKLEENLKSGIKSFAIIPKNSTNIQIFIQSGRLDDDIQIFTRSGEHIIGTTPNTTPAWLFLESEEGSNKDATYINSRILTEANGFNPGASYSNNNINSTGSNIAFNGIQPYNEF